MYADLDKIESVLTVCPMGDAAGETQLNTFEDSVPVDVTWPVDTNELLILEQY